MTIELTCACGRACRIKDTFAGRKIRCPACSKVLEVPVPEGNRDIEQEALDLLLTDPPGGEKAVRTGIREEAPQPPPTQAAPQKSVMKAPSKAPKRAKTSTQRSERRPSVVFEEGWFGSLNSGVIGGLLTMLIAIVWFVAGLAADRIFFYPPILLVFGLIATIKGLFGGE
jgi:hypothetical protein